MTLLEKHARTQWFISGIAAALVSVVGMANLLGVGVGDSDASAWGRSGLKLHTDHLTGCQYFQAPKGGLTPRVDAQSKHICVKTGAKHEPPTNLAIPHVHGRAVPTTGQAAV